MTTYHNIEITDERVYLISDLIDGKPLKSYLKRLKRKKRKIEKDVKIFNI